MKCDLNKAKRKHISGSTVKSSICTATLFLLPQLRTVHPACCPFSATRPDRKPTQSNSKYLFSILSWSPSIASPIAAVRTKNTISKHGLRVHMYVFIQTCIYDDTRTHKNRSPCLRPQRVPLPEGRSHRAPGEQTRNAACSPPREASSCPKSMSSPWTSHSEGGSRHEG